jgi:hypothetical protein
MEGSVARNAWSTGRALLYRDKAVSAARRQGIISERHSAPIQSRHLPPAKSPLAQNEHYTLWLQCGRVYNGINLRAGVYANVEGGMHRRRWSSDHRLAETSDSQRRSSVAATASVTSAYNSQQPTGNLLVKKLTY